MINELMLSSDADAPSRIFPSDNPLRGAFGGLIFVLGTQGEAAIEADGKRYTLKKGKMLTTLPAHLVRIEKQTANFRCLTLGFTFDFMSDFPYMVTASVSQKMVNTPLVELTKEEFHRLKSCHQAITNHTASENHPSYTQILRSLLFIFTAEVGALYSEKPTKSTATYFETITDGFFKQLHENFTTHRDVVFYADKLCVSTRYLEKVLLRVTGHTPAYWIADFTIRQAKMLLKSTTLTITELSEKLNFANSSFFAKYFKRHTGLSPQEYRLTEQ